MRTHLIFSTLFVLFVITFGFIVESQRITTEDDKKHHGRSKYVIIDTDGGVDDALALMLAFDAHKKGRMKVLAVTCSYGNTDVDQVVSNVMWTRRVMGTEDIKVYRGAESPLHSMEGYRDNYFGYDGFGNASDSMPHMDINVEDEHAANAISRLAKEHPKKITMITMGPLTNLAMAIQLDSDLSDELNQIIAMGGILDIMGGVGPTIDFNFYNDPEAVDIVFRKTTCPLTIIPLDICNKNFQSMKRLIKVEKGQHDSRADFFNKITEYNLQNDNGDGMVLGDIFGVITALAPKHVQKWDKYPVDIELKGDTSRGQINWNFIGRGNTDRENTDRGIANRGGGAGGGDGADEGGETGGETGGGTGRRRTAYFIREFDFEKILDMTANMLGE